jgi:pimeloyl-ACP methyl ester carboxylesterase
VNFHFFGGELKTFDWFDELNRIRCPTLILAGEVDPIATVLDHEELAASPVDETHASRIPIRDRAARDVAPFLHTGF